jgi:hypothetical protein
MQKKVTILTGWQVLVAFLLFTTWIAGDFVLLSKVDTSVLDCLGGGGSRRSSTFETLVCHPLLLGEGVYGWLTVAWFWAPIFVLVWWLRRS